jgi:DNA-binding PadR family transcriptional regulator
METSEQGKRYVIWFLWKQGKKMTDIIRELGDVYGEQSPSHSAVYKWVDRFASG